MSDHFPERSDANLLPEDWGRMGARAEVAEGLFGLLVGGLGFSDFCREAIGLVARSFRCESASFLEWNPEDEVFFFRAAIGRGAEKLEDICVPKGLGVVGHVAESRETLVVNSPDENPKHINAVSNSVGAELRNIAALPVIVRGRVFGVLELMNRLGDAGFEPTEIDHLEAAALTFGRALELRMVLAWANRRGSGGRSSDGQAAA